jgi:hypothetical protein
MYGLEEIDLELARQHHTTLVREAALERALAVANTDAEYAATIGGGIAISIIADAIRSAVRWLVTTRRRPAEAGSQ